ncbi:hypothetical protein OSTOST_19014, partial [Ostertagia ostertagi]
HPWNNSSIDEFGRDTVIGAIEGLSRTEQFVRAAQKPQPLTKTPNELFLDYHFIKMFKSSESQLIKMLRPSGEFNGTTSNDNIIQSFKSDKSELERELESVRKNLEESLVLNAQSEGMQLQMQEMYRVNEQWRAEAAKYKQWAEQWQQYQIAQLPNPTETAVQYLQQQVQQLEQQLAYGYQAFEEHMGKSGRNRRGGELAKEKESKKQQNAVQNGENGLSELAALKAEQEDLLVLLADQHNKITQYRNRLKDLHQDVTDDEDD